MSDQGFKFEQVSETGLDLDQSLRSSESAMADFARQAWSPQKNNTAQALNSQNLLESGASTAVGASSGALLAMGGLYAKDRATELAVNIVRVPLGIGLSMISGRVVQMPPYTIESNLLRVAPKGALIGAAIGLATYGAYKLYQNYYSGSSEKQS